MRAGEDNYYVYTQSIEFTADKSNFSFGSPRNELTTVEQELADYAKEHRLFYSSPKNAADALLALANIRKTTRCVKRLRFGILTIYLP